jgi:hypothetical protein
MLAAALTAAALALAIVALLIDGLRRDRDIRRLRALTEEQRMQLDELTSQQFKLHARQDRLTNMVVDRGWRDSMLLTRFDWRKPPRF